MSRLTQGLLLGLAGVAATVVAAELWLPETGGKAITFINPALYAQAADYENTALAVEEQLRTSLLRERTLPPLLTALTFRLGGQAQICRTPIARKSEAVVGKTNCRPATTEKELWLAFCAKTMLKQRRLKQV